MTDTEAQVHMPELVAPVLPDGELDVKDFLKHIYSLYDNFLVHSSFFYLINHDGATPQEVQEQYNRIKNMYTSIIEYLKQSTELYNPYMTKDFKLIGKKGREADSYMRAVDKALKTYNKKQLTIIF
jgi:hypothetical protein